MMYRFLTNNRDELIDRCTAKVTKRSERNATAEQLKNGVPMFLNQLTLTLEAEERGEEETGLAISGASGGEGSMLSQIGISAAAHGKQLLELNYSIDQVVHDYGDLCQAITDLAYERDAPFAVDEFRTLNRCLDNAIADAVTEFSFQRDAAITLKQTSEVNQRLGFLMHELRNSLQAGMLAVDAIQAGRLPLSGATGSVLMRSHLAMSKLIDRSLQEVKAAGGEERPPLLFSLSALILEAKESGDLDASARGVTFNVGPVDETLGLEANRDLILAALANLLSNAFKFTEVATTVALTAFAQGDRILIEVKDACGGLPEGNAERMFIPFSQRSGDKSGAGLGLSIARQSVMADGGTLSVRNLPGDGCVFTINLPRCTFLQ
jgi:signal transduction histidine kinase